MVDIRETDLPGVGKKYSIQTASGETVVLVVHTTGEREIYRFPPGADIPAGPCLELTDEEARRIGAILGGAFFAPKVTEAADLVMRELTIEWVNVRPASPLAGRTIEETAIGRETGAYVLAIIREGKNMSPPIAAVPLRPNDVLLVTGSHEQIARFHILLRKLAGEGGTEGKE